MIARLFPVLFQQSRIDERFRPRRINREPSPLIAAGVPWASVMLLSMATFSPVIASAAILPPMSFMLLIGWRILRPGLLPVWAGAPLGAFDDLYSGQPFGSAILLWSLAMIAMEGIDVRFRYRGFLQDWIVAALIFSSYILLAALVAAVSGSGAALYVVVPQVVLTVSLYPIIAGVIVLLDRMRLLPLKTAGQ